MKYELLLRDIYKHTERAGLVQELPNLQNAIYVMKVSVIPMCGCSNNEGRNSIYLIMIHVCFRLFRKRPTI